jgi:hypothetical protein
MLLKVEIPGPLYIGKHCHVVISVYVILQIPKEKEKILQNLSQFALRSLRVLHTEDPLELCLKSIKANTEALIQSINCVISYTLCLIVSMPYGLSLLL